MKRMICCHSESLMHHPAQYNSILCEQNQPQHHDIMSVVDGDITLGKHLYMRASHVFSENSQIPPG